MDSRAVTHGKFDFIIDLEGNLHLGKKHSFLSKGSKEIQAAGTISLHKGKVKSITNDSGHYKPNANESKKYSAIFIGIGVDVSGAKLKIYGVDGKLLETLKL